MPTTLEVPPQPYLVIGRRNDASAPWFAIRGDNGQVVLSEFETVEKLREAATKEGYVLLVDTVQPKQQQRRRGKPAKATTTK